MEAFKSNQSMPKSFYELMHAEILRMRDPTVTGPPAVKAPLTLNEYRAYVQDANVNRPTDKQIAELMRSFQNILPDFMRYARAGYRAVPVFMLSEHGYETADPRLALQYGNLYFYLLNERNLTVRPDDIAYVDAVLPPELITNCAVVPEKLYQPDQAKKFCDDFDARVKRLIAMIFNRNS